jgi:UDP-3-O-[3-hydroxymyristoyl] N-acetylglucosamine deacetylase
MGGHRGGQRMRQSTLRRSTTLSGIGVHSGKSVAVTLHPADADSGITFVRTGADGGREHEVPANFRHVSATDLCTVVGVPGASVATVEHLLAAFSALDVDNAIVEIDGAEVPVMDGSAGDFISAVDEAGVAGLDAPLRSLKVIKPIRVENGESYAEFAPHDGRRIEVEIDFDTPLIGRQQYAVDLDSKTFRRDIARARTFGFLAEVEKLWERGFALGASLENAVVIGDDRIMNPEGLRFGDEFVRHKVLDAIGDLALAGVPILGCYRSFRGGHKLNIMALKALIEDESAWTLVEAPFRRESGHAEAPTPAVAYGPDAS